MKTDPLHRTKEEYAEILGIIGAQDSPVGIDAMYTHAIIIEYLRQIDKRLERLEAAMQGNEGAGNG